MIQVFTSSLGGLSQCKNLCEKVQNGTVATLRSPAETQAMFGRVKEVLVDTTGRATRAGTIGTSAWAPIRRASDGSWIDVYNKEPLKDLVWANGHPLTDQCSLYVPPWNGLISFHCMVDASTVKGIYCACRFPVSPKLKLRGLCLYSHIDQVYLARNDPVTGYLFFYGTHKTIASSDGENWKMFTAFFNTSGSTDAKPNTFILGKHSWIISGDSKECHAGKPYTTELKLTGCKEGDFTCNDGQCIKMD